jgi:calcium-dependent protein kinase
MMRALDHPNIAKILEIFDEEDKLYLVEEQCKGGDLFDYIINNGSLSQRDAAVIMKEILGMLSFIHGQNIVHRDIKPENLMFLQDNDLNSLKLIDLDTMCIVDEGTKARELYGTPYYIAPEVLAKKYDSKCDVWSAGVILYILLTGQPPFSGFTDAEILSKVKDEEVAYDEAFWSDKVEAKAFLQKLLNKNPEERLSASDALQDPWFEATTTGEAMAENIPTLNSLASFKANGVLKIAVMKHLGKQISPV